MRTPCQEAPEAWVGDDRNLREQAARECMGCPALDWCQDEARKNPPEFGVMAAVDYTRPRKNMRVDRESSKVCGFCGERFWSNVKESTSQWVARKTCSRSCGSRAGHARKAA